MLPHLTIDEISKIIDLYNEIYSIENEIQKCEFMKNEQITIYYKNILKNLSENGIKYNIKRVDGSVIDLQFGFTYND